MGKPWIFPKKAPMMFLSGSFTVYFVVFPPVWLWCSQWAKFEMNQNDVPKMFQGSTFRMSWQFSHNIPFLAHHSGSFQILLTGNITITLVGTLQSTLWMSHSGTSWVLSLGKFKVSHGLPNWNIAIIWPGTLQMYWAFSALGILQWNWLRKFWMYLKCTSWMGF